MGKFQDLSGQKFGRLTVIKRVDDYVSPSNNHLTQYLCRCTCGNELIVQACSLKGKLTTSCGCVRKEKVSAANKKHGLSHTHARLYKIWTLMKERCLNSKYKGFKDYGGRGITVCKEWKDDFQNFYDWSISTGYNENAKRGKCTIDRIDVNGNYEPNNCRWVSIKEQQRNKRNNKLITINGQTLTLVEWCELLNLNYKTVHSRLFQCHWSPERALERI